MDVDWTLLLPHPARDATVTAARRVAVRVLMRFKIGAHLDQGILIKRVTKRRVPDMNSGQLRTAVGVGKRV